MPFGKYKDRFMHEVPASYLLYLLDNGLKDGPIKDYIIENLDSLRRHDYIEKEGNARRRILSR